MADYTNPGRRIKLDSSNLDSLSYDGELGVLDIWFHAKGTVVSRYRYYKVPAEIVTHIIFAPSQGQAFITLVKNVDFHFEKVAEL